MLVKQVQDGAYFIFRNRWYRKIKQIANQVHACRWFSIGRFWLNPEIINANRVVTPIKNCPW